MISTYVINTSQLESVPVPPMDLSIIVVSWNTRDILRDCLASIFASPRRLSLEVFVIDNASNDGSADMVRAQFPAVKLIRNQRNRGFAAANNQALSLARGQYALLLNSDTVILDDVLEKSLKYMDDHRDVGVMGCRVLNPDRTLQPTCFQFPTLLNLFLVTVGLARLPWPRFFGRYRMRGWNRDTERDVDVVTGCYMLVRSAAMLEVGLLDESFFFFAEETDWCKRFRKDGWKVRFAPAGEIIHYGGASAKQLNDRREVLLARAMIGFHRKHGGPLAAIAVRLLLWMSYFTRYIALTLACIIDRKGRLSDRRNHFRSVLQNFPGVSTTTEFV